MKNKKYKVTGIVIITIICSVLIIGLFAYSAISSLFGSTSSIYIEKVTRLPSTDLSNILVDNIKIGYAIADIDLTVYTEDHPNTTGDYDYFFDQVRIGVDEDNKINSVTADYHSVSINGSTDLYRIDEVTGLLGTNYLDKSQDSEQKLRKHVYYDSNTGVMAEFVYAKQTNDFAWLVVRKIR